MKVISFPEIKKKEWLAILSIKNALFAIETKLIKLRIFCKGHIVIREKFL